MLDKRDGYRLRDFEDTAKTQKKLEWDQGKNAFTGGTEFESELQFNTYEAWTLTRRSAASISRCAASCGGGQAHSAPSSTTLLLHGGGHIRILRQGTGALWGEI